MKPHKQRKTTIGSTSIHSGCNFPSFPLRSFVVGAVLLATSALTPAAVTLKGKVGPRIIYDDVVIARGTTCILNGTTIKGNVRVHYGAKLYANGAWVDGSVYAYRAFLVDLRHSTLVTWNVRGNGTRSLLLRDDARVGGNVRLTDASAPNGVNALRISNSAVAGDVVVRDSRGKMRILYNRIEGKLNFIGNRVGQHTLRSNIVWGNLSFYRNRGEGFIIENTVGGQLMTKGNSPKPQVLRNNVREETLLN